MGSIWWSFCFLLARLCRFDAFVFAVEGFSCGWIPHFLDGILVWLVFDAMSPAIGAKAGWFFLDDVAVLDEAAPLLKVIPHFLARILV
jgi:hypothetical protein